MPKVKRLTPYVILSTRENIVCGGPQSLHRRQIFKCHTEITETTEILLMNTNLSNLTYPFYVDDKLIFFESILKVHFQKCFKKISTFVRNNAVLSKTVIYRKIYL